MIFILIKAVSWFAQVLIYLLLGRAIMSWFVRDPSSQLFNLYQLAIRLTEPILMPCRRLLSRFNTGMMDFSILLAFLIISFARNIIITILYTFV